MKQSLLNMKAAMIATLLAMLAIPAANAWTAQQLVDFCEGKGYELIGSYANQNSLAINTHKITVGVETDEDGTQVMRLDNFLGAWTIYFRISGNTATVYDIQNMLFDPTAGSGSSVPITSGSTTYYAKCIYLQRVIRVNVTYPGTGYYYDVNGVYRQGSPYKFIADQKAGSYHYTYLPTEQLQTLKASTINTSTSGICNGSVDLKGTISNDEYGNVKIKFGPYTAWNNSNSWRVNYYTNYSMNNLIGADQFDNIEFTLYKANATVTDSKHNSPYAARYVDIENNDQYNFGIVNFADKGAFYGNFNPNGNLTGASSQRPYYTNDIVKGKITGNSVVIPQQNYATIVSGVMDATHSQSSISNTNFYTCGFDAATQKPRADKAITGTITGSSIPYHTGNTSWHHSLFGGDLHTYKGGQVIELDPFGFTDNGANTTAWADTYKNMKITLSDPIECTFHCQTFALSDFTHDPSKHFIMEDGVKKYYINIGSVTLADCINTDHVKNIELMVVDNLHLTTSTIDLSQARRVAYLSCPQPGEDSEEYNKKFFPTMITNPTTGKVEMLRDYTFFLRVNYKDDFAAAPGVRMAATLEPSHHNMTAKNIDEVVTSVDGIETMGDVMMKATQRGVIVTAPYDCDVTVYNMAGIAVANGTANTEIAVNANGVFIVKAAGKAFKLIR